MADKKPPQDEQPTGASEDQLMTQGQFTSILTQLVSGLQNLALKPAQLKEILDEVGKTNAEIARKARWPENPDHLHVSAYFTQADKDKYGGEENKPKLKRITWFCGVREEEDRLTVAEVEAYNSFTQPMECRGGAWRAVIKKPTAVGGKEELYIFVPKETVDQRMVLPSLHLILHELNGGPSTEDVMGLLKQIEALKKLLTAKGTTVAELEAAMLAQ